jgi:small nuclear ribonucleoprotein G
VGKKNFEHMTKANGPDLKRYMDKRLALKMNGNRKVTGVLRGFDQFMNVTLEETVEEVSTTESNRIGMVVSLCFF